MADAHDPFPACDVCGRTILKGEQIHEYLTPQRERIRVCVLCRSRAESEGWLPVSMAHTLEDDQPRSRGLAIRERFSRAASRARSAARARRESAPEHDREPEYEAPPEAVERPPVAEVQPPSEPVEEPQPEPAPKPEKEPAPEAEEKRAPGRERAPKPRARRPTRSRAPKREAKPARERASTPRRTRAKRGPEALMRRAVERFNASEERRKVAGLMRSLGEPQAGVRADPRRQLALVTVAWELSWYQWEVGADGEGDEPVREVAKGAEVSELDEKARAWNAAVDEDGALRLRSAAERQPQEAANEA